MRNLFTILIVIVTLFKIQNGYAQKTKSDFSPIRIETPERPAGQKDVLQLTTPKMETVRVGFIGLGMRGPGAVERFIHIPGTQIVALCDIYPERVEKAQKYLVKAGLPKAAEYSGSEDAWKKLCERTDIDLVYIVTDWKNHAEMGVYAMENGKHVAIEVPAAMTLDEIWKLINTSERTRKHCMQLENCVYDFFELTTLNMAQQGVFGEILHAEGAYIHNLEDFWAYYWNNWRMDYNRKFRGDVYATHGMGPACQLLDIHRGDRMKTLVSMDTKAVNGPAYIKNKTGEEVKDFQNGDQTTTMIRTEKGKTMLIQHNVMTPRPYSRMYQAVGTDGFADKYPKEMYCLRPTQVDSDIAPDHEKLNAHGPVTEEVKKALMEKYKHPIHRELEETAKKVGGHGGMDYIMDYRLIYCLRNGLPLDMDVYDLAEWCCLAELSRISIENGSAPVEVPDFTRGGWERIKGYRHAFAN
ncbi:oxidoreductase, NAD-binding domain protein [Bacteroides pyogenes F0041]|uniref:Oxidoreductase, NAD-binding domain protein n=1 Tax=Bacteroides pyogenes F0041 TaxID=1321819 RepID=U2CE18_9BACE|nr:Gfo/Idh/MocA family oxidoreductase [Bacteroides pyogenes]ERI88724.1 oxidoreductase, NAD-binding domain protein [Bacteroides pyogenes F0041]MBB3895183.1 putative dehydrogenase [Bacteroides pyogenes]GAE21797.1 DNA topoisomerase III [Bacteroides pyogenes JCM 10003]SUV36297.1 oxidoreductase [Bacteroides pyogenes]